MLQGDLQVEQPSKRKRLSEQINSSLGEKGTGSNDHVDAVPADAIHVTDDTIPVDDAILDFNFTVKSLRKHRGSVYGKWILDRRLGSPCIKKCLEIMAGSSTETHLIDEYVNTKDRQHDIMCYIDRSDTHFKIKSFYLQDYESTPRVITLPIGKEIVENNGAKRTLLTCVNPSHISMKRTIMTYNGFIEYSDIKEIVPFTKLFEHTSIPKDYMDKPDLFMRQFVTVTNHETGETSSLSRFYLPVE